MDKFQMRDYLIDLETQIDSMLKKWKKDKIENGKVVQLTYKFEIANIILDVFWTDGHERVKLECRCANRLTEDDWEGLTDKTFDNVLDRVGNFAMVFMNRHRE